MFKDLEFIPKEMGIYYEAPPHIDVKVLQISRPRPLTPLVYEIYRIARNRPDFRAAIYPRLSDEDVRFVDNLVAENRISDEDFEVIQRFNLLDVNTSILSGQVAERYGQFRFLYDYFVPHNIQYDFEQRVDRCEIYTWSYGGNNNKKKHFRLRIFEGSDVSLNRKWIEKIARVLSVLSTGYFFSCETMDIMIFPSLLTKKASTQGAIWTPHNINTACTMRGSCNSIFVWRKEEIIKTLIHELIHALSLDFTELPRYVTTYVNTHFSVYPLDHVRLFEAYTEWWANIINLSFVASTQPYESVETLYGNERDHCLRQSAKILLISGFTSWRAFMTPWDGSTEGACFRQSTSVFSYFLVRAAFYFDPWFPEVAFRYIRFKDNRITLEEVWNRVVIFVFQNPTFGAKIDSLIHQEANVDYYDDSMRMSFSHLGEPGSPIGPPR